MGNISTIDYEKFPKQSERVSKPHPDCPDWTIMREDEEHPFRTILFHQERQRFLVLGEDPTKELSPGSFLKKRTRVCFYYQEKTIEGIIVRDDSEHTLIRLDDGRLILTTECQYSPFYGETP